VTDVVPDAARYGLGHPAPTRPIAAGEDGVAPTRDGPPEGRGGIDVADTGDIDAEYVDFFVIALPRAVAAARRITGDLAAAEDAASEALARAYLRWPSLRTLPYRDAWVLRVATNEAIGTVRKHARRERILRRQPARPPVTDDPVETRAWVVDQLRRLPTRQREVVALRYYADLSTSEVASTLGLSEGTVKSHLHRALQTLRERLGPDIVEGSFP
jgi:RNA polymerase sigma-70 factor (ECF subfamily)